MANKYLATKRQNGEINQRSSQQLRYQLDSFTDLCSTKPDTINKRDVHRWMKAHTHLSASSRRQYFNRIRAFTKWLQQEGHLGRDPFAGIAAPKVPRSVHRALTDDQVRALLAACITPRETVIVVLGVQAGLRRAEIAGLEVGDVDLVQRTVFVRCGKGGHQRLLPLSTEAVRVLAGYVAGGGLRFGPLLRSMSNPNAGIGPHAVGISYSTLAYRAGVKVRAFDGVGSHSSRHTFASEVAATAGVLAARDLLGHQSLATTQVYVRGMNLERLRVAVEGRSYLDAA